MTYRAYVRVIKGDNGMPLGAIGLLPVAENLSAHAKALAEEQDPNWPIRYSAFTVATHLGKPVIRMVVDQAWEARVAYRAARRFLDSTGWQVQWVINANTSRAI